MDNSKTELFESMPIPKAVITLSVPSVISSLVMVIYSLADTFFVGMMNDPGAERRCYAGGTASAGVQCRQPICSASAAPA